MTQFWVVLNTGSTVKRMNVYRIQKDKHRDTILTGEGARLNGGRWNLAGHPLVYTSSSMELALLETTVHFDGTPPLDLPPYILVTIQLPDHFVVHLDPVTLPKDWNLFDDYPADELDTFLQNEFRQKDALALAVPSVIIPRSTSRNILLNPLDTRMSEVKIVDISSHEIDPRLP